MPRPLFVRSFNSSPHQVRQVPGARQEKVFSSEASIPQTGKGRWRKKIHRKQRGFLRGTGKQRLPWAPRLVIALQLYGSRGLDVPNLGIILKSAHKTTRKRKSKNVLAT